MSAKLYDISRTISNALHVWPGDTPPNIRQTAAIKDGSSVNLFAITMGMHTGTHIDAPYHYTEERIHPDMVPLESYIGPAQVITLSRREGAMVPADFNVEIRAPRVLIHTRMSDIPDTEWDTTFPYPSPELADWLAAKGVILFGLDSPSVDGHDSKALPGHHRLWHHKILNVENVVLKGVPDGLYELIALPLKIAGVCGSPVRAILRETIPSPE